MVTTARTSDAEPELIRLMIKVARMYHERGVRQPEIASRLHISQARVSRLLKRAGQLNIVRTTVVTPPGVFADLEELVEQRFGLREVVIADTGDDVAEQSILHSLGAAAAAYLETTLIGGDRIGISSWSSTLLASVDAMRPKQTPVAEQVVQVLGGVGLGSAQEHATRLIGRLAELTGAAPLYLSAPGLVASSALREALASDPSIDSVMSAYERLTMVLMGIGSLEPSALLRASGNAMAERDHAELLAAGAVGDVCLRFFNELGEPIRTALDERVIGISASTLRAIPRKIGVAGGERKYAAIRAALRGGWANILVTDLATARRLAGEPL